MRLCSGFISRLPQLRLCAVCAFLLVSGAVSIVAQAAAAADRDSRTLRVGTKQSPPFAIEHDGGWRGVSISLWREFASEMGIEYEIVELPLTDLLAGLGDGSLDAGVAALTLTADREAEVDFSYPFILTGLGIGVPIDESVSVAVFLRRFTSGPFVRLLGLSVLALSVASIFLWFFEARRNPDHFGGNLIEGIGSALWWSAVTMTTVGYGDKAPRTVPGRILAVVWMIAGVILISALTASITSALTVSHLESSISGPRDLVGQTVCTIEGSTSAEYLDRNGIRAVLRGSIDECVDSLNAGGVNALIYDVLLLRYWVITNPERAFQILPNTFARQGYGVGLPSQSPLREPLNRFILRHIRSDEWRATLTRYIGAEGADDA